MRYTGGPARFVAEDEPVAGRFRAFDPAVTNDEGCLDQVLQILIAVFEPP